MLKTTTMKKFNFNLLFFALSFYCMGAGFMDSFVIYDGWNFVGKTEFPTMHQAMSQRIITTFVLPMFILFVLTIFQYWLRPASIPRSWVTMALISQLVGWLSSVFIQIPIQTQLSQGKDEALLEKLIVSDWLRVFAWLIYIIIVLAMLYRIHSTYLPVNRKKLSVGN
jgi:hypothetical protein